MRLLARSIALDKRASRFAVCSGLPIKRAQARRPLVKLVVPDVSRLEFLYWSMIDVSQILASGLSGSAVTAIRFLACPLSFLANSTLARVRPLAEIKTIFRFAAIPKVRDSSYGSSALADPFESASAQRAVANESPDPV